MEDDFLREIYGHFRKDGDRMMGDLITFCLCYACKDWLLRCPRTGDKDCWEMVKEGLEISFGGYECSGVLTLESVCCALEMMKRKGDDCYDLLRCGIWDEQSCDMFFQYAVFGDIMF